jgi:hypothetical protein
MLYRAAEQRIVQDAEEENLALSAGFSRTPPQAEAGFTKWMIENPQRKRRDYRGVLLL